MKIDCVYVTVKARKRDEKKGERGTFRKFERHECMSFHRSKLRNSCEQKKAFRCEGCSLEYCPRRIAENISPAQFPLLLLDINFFFKSEVFKKKARMLVVSAKPYKRMTLTELNSKEGMNVGLFQIYSEWEGRKRELPNPNIHIIYIVPQ